MKYFIYLTNLIKRNCFACYITIFGLFAVDRLSWTYLSQWREDQATNIWLGYTRPFLEMPVGITTSYGIPNPNGMPLLAFFLSRLPDLFSVSLFISLLQMLLIIWVCRLLFDENNHFLIVSTGVLSSFIVRSTSVEFWNNWILTSLNLLFFALILIYLRKPRLSLIPAFVVLILSAPSIYLAGIVNALSYFIFTILLIFIKPPSVNKPIPTYLTITLIVFVSVVITWMPFFKEITLTQLDIDHNKFANIFSSLTSVVVFPISVSLQWSTNALAFTFFGDKISISKTAIFLGELSGVITFILALTFLILFILKSEKIKNFKPILAFFIAWMFYIFSPILGGPTWALWQRPEQTTQLFPLLLIAWFSVPFALDLPQTISRVAAFSVILFIIVNLTLGFVVARSHLSYDGNQISAADVPLVYKMKVSDYIAKEWKQKTNKKEIPIYYDLSKGPWSWLTKHGESMQKWYPAPLTVGRAFDYELYKKHGLTNTQEGKQKREIATEGFVISYSFEVHPLKTLCNSHDVYIGRYRVSVCEQFYAQRK